MRAESCVYRHRLVLSWWMIKSHHKPFLSLWAGAGSVCPSIIPMLCLTDLTPPSLSYVSLMHRKINLPSYCIQRIPKPNGRYWELTPGFGLRLAQHPLIRKWLKASQIGGSKDSKVLSVPNLLFCCERVTHSLSRVARVSSLVSGGSVDILSAKGIHVVIWR